MVVDSIEHLDTKRANLAKRLVIFVKDKMHVDQLLETLPPVIAPFCGGDCAVQFSYQSAEAKANIDLGKKWMVQPKNALLAQLKQLCGEECVKVGY